MSHYKFLAVLSPVLPAFKDKKYRRKEARTNKVLIIPVLCKESGAPLACMRIFFYADCSSSSIAAPMAAPKRLVVSVSAILQIPPSFKTFMGGNKSSPF